MMMWRWYTIHIDQIALFIVTFNNTDEIWSKFTCSHFLNFISSLPNRAIDRRLWKRAEHYFSIRIYLPRLTPHLGPNPATATFHIYRPHSPCPMSSPAAFHNDDEAAYTFAHFPLFLRAKTSPAPARAIWSHGGEIPRWHYFRHRHAPPRPMPLLHARTAEDILIDAGRAAASEKSISGRVYALPRGDTRYFNTGIFSIFYVAALPLPPRSHAPRLPAAAAYYHVKYKNEKVIYPRSLNIYWAYIRKTSSRRQPENIYQSKSRPGRGNLRHVIVQFISLKRRDMCCC